MLKMMMLYRKRYVQQLNFIEGKINCDSLESNINVFPFSQTEKAKWEPLNVLSKLEGDKDRKTGK